MKAKTVLLPCSLSWWQTETGGIAEMDTVLGVYADTPSGMRSARRIATQFACDPDSWHRSAFVLRCRIGSRWAVACFRRVADVNGSIRWVESPEALEEFLQRARCA